MTRWPTRYRWEIACASALGIVVFAASLFAQRGLNPMVFNYAVTESGGAEEAIPQPYVSGPRPTDIWFDGDPPKIRWLATDRLADRPAFSTKHPLFWGIAFASTHALRSAGMGWRESLALLSSLAAALWAVSFFVFLRLLSGRVVDAVVFAALATTSAAATFWFIVPEVFVSGSITIVLALVVAAAADRRAFSAATYAMASAATLSMTITNWMVGILTTFVGLPRRAALRATVSALVAVCVLWIVQKLVVPPAGFFLAWNSSDQEFMLAARSGGVVRKALSFAFHTVVMPSIEIRKLRRPELFGLSVQHSWPGSTGLIGLAAVVLWGVILAAGAFGLLKAGSHHRVRTVLGLALAMQLGLHLVYGIETFLYSMHFLPLLVGTAACGVWNPRYRRSILIGAVVLTVLCAANNWTQLNRAFSMVDQIVAVAQGAG